jgi:hypothetical protein
MRLDVRMVYSHSPFMTHHLTTLYRKGRILGEFGCCLAVPTWLSKEDIDRIERNREEVVEEE